MIYREVLKDPRIVLAVKVAVDTSAAIVLSNDPEAILVRHRGPS